MKSAIALFLMITALSGCANIPFSANPVAPDVPEIDHKIQDQAADEMESRQCPALNTIINYCLITRDQARELNKLK